MPRNPFPQRRDMKFKNVGAMNLGGGKVNILVVKILFFKNIVFSYSAKRCLGTHV